MVIAMLSKRKRRVPMLIIAICRPCWGEVRAALHRPTAVP
jgi:hypothetical protein